MSVIFENFDYGSLEDFSAGSNSRIKTKSIQFAHPIDSKVIKVLESAYIKNIFNDAVKLLVSAEHGMLLSSGIAINNTNFPELNNVLIECCDTLSIPVPYAVVTNEIPGINAMATGTDDFSFIAVSNYMPKLLTIDEQKFILAHECGHIALGHIVYHTAVSLIANFGQVLPIIGPVIAETISFPLNTWNRCSEITADRAGLICCRDLKTAQRALLKIIGGFTDVENVDIDAYIEQSRATLNNQGIGKYSELLMQHPIIFKRLKALDVFSKSEMYYRITGQKNISNIKLLSDSELNKRITEIIKII